MFEVPDKLDLVVFFEAEPIESEPQDGLYFYKYVDSNEMELYFSYHAIQKSIQIRLCYRGNDVMLVSGELATSMKVEEDRLGERITCLLESNQTRTEAIVRLKPAINVKWSTLEN